MQVAAPIEFATDTPPFKRLDVVLVNHWAFALTSPRRGDVVLYNPRNSMRSRADDNLNPGHARFAFEENQLIDRVIGLPGDRVVWDQGKLSVNGEAVSWKPLLPDRLPAHLEITVPLDRYLILADDLGGGNSGRRFRVVLEGCGVDPPGRNPGRRLSALESPFTILVHPLTKAVVPDQTGRFLPCHGLTDLNLMTSPIRRSDGSHAAEVSGETERDADAWLRKADDHRRRGLYENSLRYYSRALEFDKSLLPGWVGQVQMLVMLGEYPEAELWAKKSLELFKSHGDLMAGRAQALARIGDRSVALELADAALRQEGHSAYRWMVRGELLATTRDEIDRHCFDKAVQADRDWLVPLEIALIYLHYEQPSKALSRARQAVENGTRSVLRLVRAGTMRAGAWLRPAGEDQLRALPGTLATPRRGKPQARRGRQPGLVAVEGAATLDWPLTPHTHLSPAGGDLMFWTLDKILKGARKAGASDVHLIRGLSPAFRVNGEIRLVEGEPLDEATLRVT